MDGPSNCCSRSCDDDDDDDGSVGIVLAFCRNTPITIPIAKARTILDMDDADGGVERAALLGPLCCRICIVIGC